PAVLADGRGVGRIRTTTYQTTLLEQPERDLRALVRLGQHRGAGLHQDVPAGELGRLLGDVHVADTAVGGFEVRLVGREDRGGEAEAALLGAVGGAHRRDVLDRGGDVRQGEVREARGRGIADRADAGGRVTQVLGADGDGLRAVLRHADRE